MKKTKSQKGIKKGREFQDIIVPDILEKLTPNKCKEPSKRYYGKSGFSRSPDLVIGKDKGFIEIKCISSDKEDTYKEHIDRAFTKLYDLKKAYPSAKIFLIVNKESKKHPVEYRKLTKLIGLKFINIYNETDKKLLKKEINKMK